jgi:hypothetical protein
MSKIKGSHVLVIGAGPSLKKYSNKIKDFIKKEQPVIFGCSHIGNFCVPDYHFWGSTKRWREFGHLVSKKSILMFSEYVPESIIREKWNGKYKVFKHLQKEWRKGSEDKKSYEYRKCRIYYKNKKMYGCVRNIATWAIFYAYVNRASKISIVGNDGYTLYSKKQLDNKEVGQHCFGSGYTAGYSYEYSRRSDWFKYRTLRLLCKYGRKEYGFNFEIITPTLFAEFYNPNIFNIKQDFNTKVWREPSTQKEYDQLYIKALKNNKNDYFKNKKK